MSLERRYIYDRSHGPRSCCNLNCDKVEYLTNKKEGWFRHQDSLGQWKCRNCHLRYKNKGLNELSSHSSGDELFLFFRPYRHDHFPVFVFDHWEQGSRSGNRVTGVLRTGCLSSQPEGPGPLSFCERWRGSRPLATALGGRYSSRMRVGEPDSCRALGPSPEQRHQEGQALSHAEADMLRMYRIRRRESLGHAVRIS